MRFPRIREFFASFIQNRFDVEHVLSSRKLIIFLVPNNGHINGGVLSIFHMCEATRTIVQDAKTVICTTPDQGSYAHNNYINPDENIYRFSQIINKKLQSLHITIHIPEYYANRFYQSLTDDQKNILKHIPYLRLSILNQNIDLLPNINEIHNLFLLTHHIVQLCAYEQYSNQHYCDIYHMPLHRFHVKTKIPYVHIPSFRDKKKNKIFLISKDINPNKEKVLHLIKHQLYDYKIITIQKMTYIKYWSLLAQSMFMLTFGEGYDLYFREPSFVGTMPLSVYNDIFFPSKEWKQFKNVYQSYDGLLYRLVKDIKLWENHQDIYDDIISKNKKYLQSLYNDNSYIDELSRFYKEKYDYIPQIPF